MDQNKGKRSRTIISMIIATMLVVTLGSSDAYAATKNLAKLEV